MTQVRGLLLTHGEMAEGMADAVRRISGMEAEALHALSNEGESPETLAERVDELLGDVPAIVFTDLGTGSCALVARLTCRGRGRRTVVFGVNLPMLLDFVFHRHLPLEELVPRLLEKGREGVQALDPAPPSSSSRSS